jgi:small subunit ribosomal protein S15Ae
LGSFLTFLLYRFSSDPPPRFLLSSLEWCKSTVSTTLIILIPFIGYISEFEIIDDKRNGKIVVELNGRLNKCGVISPRYDLKLKNFEKFIYNVLPSRQFGYVILTTTYGIMDHEEAKRKHIGGKVLGYFYWKPPMPQHKRNSSFLT